MESRIATSIHEDARGQDSRGRKNDRGLWRDVAGEHLIFKCGVSTGILGFVVLRQ